VSFDASALMPLVTSSSATILQPWGRGCLSADSVSQFWRSCSLTYQTPTQPRPLSPTRHIGKVEVRKCAVPVWRYEVNHSLQNFSLSVSRRSKRIPIVLPLSLFTIIHHHPISRHRLRIQYETFLVLFSFFFALSLTHIKQPFSTKGSKKLENPRKSQICDLPPPLAHHLL